MEIESRIRILSVDDHPLLREGLAVVINNQPDMILIAQACNGRDAITKYREVTPDVVLMDLRLPDMSGIDAIISIRAEFSDARILVLTTFEGDIDIQRSLEAGAKGYVIKDAVAQDLLAGIRKVYAGKSFIPSDVAARLAEHLSDEDLTPREIEVLQLMAAGNRNRGIADRLRISEETVKVHVKHIMDKLNAGDRTQAVTIALRRGILSL